MSKDPKLALVVSDTVKAQAGAEPLRQAHDWVKPAQADILVVVGGDGFLLHTLHNMLDRDWLRPCYGLNLGTVGFLMNGNSSKRTIAERVARARRVAVKPLQMRVITQDGQEFCYYAINELSLLRETRQTAKLEVKINGRVRMAELAGDGVLVATPAGSTAYNLSAHGPILPLDSNLLALTPISPFRPRRWNGALLPDRSRIQLRVREPSKRPVSAVADQKEVRDVAEVTLEIARESELTLLFDPGHALDERIVAEQFVA
jgi:NAD+ kinase